MGGWTATSLGDIANKGCGVERVSRRVTPVDSCRHRTSFPVALTARLRFAVARFLFNGVQTRSLHLY